MSTRYDTSDEAELEEGLSAAARAVQRGRLVLLPTDTVYGVGADAFSPEAVTRLLEAKGRGRQMPPPVLVSAKTTVEALAVDVPGWAKALIEELWPGPLTLVFRQQPSLQWDLGETRGTVAVRMPDHDVTLALLARTGPLAVSSANRTGLPAATDADGAEEMLGTAARVLLDAGPTAGPVPSTIVDCTTDRGRVLRQGVIALETLNEVVEPLGAVVTDED
ncbi:threonylcarbamoyl-AMP synthase [Nocardioides sp. HDW12B]|uniref:L-threonylcarbamoyladenylate synthase n=1 Tax=Nocardioides sp. HDW12B TaxID=2714939 RepID=UPI00140DB100|nr:L-threonylcarbamoyladenylate synthase [Nocardioides sp. HDW12B]QIK67115.1 threonylcarbamoyl-AMP synthase [Nocardioides sp. HDW12B]